MKDFNSTPRLSVLEGIKLALHEHNEKIVHLAKAVQSVYKVLGEFEKILKNLDERIKKLEDVS